jgi:hypothetical protein
MDQVRFVVALKYEGRRPTADEIQRGLLSQTAYPCFLSPTCDLHVNNVNVERIISTIDEL